MLFQSLLLRLLTITDYTNFFLLQVYFFTRYGVGYHMTIAKEPQCDSHAVTSLVKHTVAGAEQDTDVGAELSFILPSQSIHQFSKLFDTLDGN